MEPSAVAGADPKYSGPQAANVLSWSTVAFSRGCRANGLCVGLAVWASGVIRGLIGGERRCGACQAPLVAIWCLWSFRRLCVAVINRHSARTADLPRLRNRLIPRLNLVWAKTGSIIACLRL